MELTVKSHIYNLSHFVDLGEIEYNLNVENIYEGDDNYEKEFKERYDYELKYYLLKMVFEDNDFPDNFLELIDTMKVDKTDTSEYIDTYNIKIDEPKWDDFNNTRKMTLRKNKLDKIKNKLI